MNAEGNPLAQEITAQLQLGLMGTVGKLARQLRSIDRIAPRLKDGGIVRKLPVDRDQKRRSVGLSVAHRKIGAFGGLLYGAAAVAHDLTTAAADIIHGGQESRLDVGDMTLLEAERRLSWKTYTLVYDLLEEIFQADPLPDLILLDMPLIMGRRVYAQALDDAETDAELRREVRELRDRLEAFWEKHISRCFPFDPDGPKVVTLDRGRFGSLLRLLKSKSQEVTPDPIDGEVERLIREEWTQVLSVGIDRVLAGILNPDYRTAAFNREQDLRDKRAFPQSIIEKGTIAFHYLTGLRGTPIQVETLGSAAHWREPGGEAAIDALASDLISLTYFDVRQAVPLPLWYAQQSVQIIKKTQGGQGLLEFYKREALRAMQQELRDRAWLAGWEDE
ncbi:hypothetical protein Mal4_19550 [Maioricimonas rarisocia]|uniref:DNA double-strand break repair nuclease NurA n=1 Tax=Maioricimonas rarisocia TaxID=2528026 RepID=A0A517Z573_9PLAN|nr:hypothetical protein [Maioricimonas rarisocia]QDU37640.1 hypothetical protein Mal4_19550 [Maioricimonas rarisocia]